MECFKLPLGYKFEPTDQDLMKHLLYKAAGNPLWSNGYIEDYDLYNVEPDELFRGLGKDVRYLFVKPKKKVQGGSRFSRRVGKKAVWKGSNKGSPVHNLRGMAVGLKKKFVYMLINGKNSKDNIHGGYIMDEFSLKEFVPNIEGYVLCRVKKRPQKKNDDVQDHDNGDSNMISEVADYDYGEVMQSANEDHVQDHDVVDDFIEIDELLSNLDEGSNSGQLHDDHQSPLIVINVDVEDYADDRNTMAMVNIDKKGNESFGTEELVSCIDFGVSDFIEDHETPLMLTMEADSYASMEAAVIDTMQSVDNQPLVEKEYTTEELVSCVDFGVSDFDQDHADPLVLNTEADCYAPMEAAVIDPMQSVDNQPLVEKQYTTEGLVSCVDFGVSDFDQDHADTLVLNTEADCYAPMEAAVIDTMQSVDNQPLVEKQYTTEGLVSCVDFGVSDFDQDHADTLVLNTEADCYAPMEAAVIDPMQSVDNQPLMEKAHTIEELLSEIHNAKTLPESLRSIEEFLLGDFD